MKTRILAWTAFALALAGPKIASAQTATPPDTNAPAMQPAPDSATPNDMSTTPVPDDRSYNYTVPNYEYRSSRPSFVKVPGGMELEAGGGVLGFFNSDVRDVTKVGGGYNVRLGYGTRSPIGIEAAYIGSTQSMSALGMSNDALLVSNGAEGLIRINLTPNTTWQPFIAAGAAWRHYYVHANTNTSNVRDTDNTIEIPANVGLAFRAQGFVLDARAGYRQSFSNDLLGNANLSSWSGNLNLGVEF
jgi:hypothetical protein